MMGVRAHSNSGVFLFGTIGMRTLLIALTAFLATVSVAMAQAELPKNMKALKESMFRQTNSAEQGLKIPPQAQFRSPSGQEFALNARPDLVLIRFEGDEEVYALTPVLGAKGDMIFKNDVGESVLRATRWGGYTVFSHHAPSGEAVAIVGRSQSFDVGGLNPAQLFKHLARSSYRASQAAKSRIIFDAEIDDQDSEADTLGLFADAASVTTEAIVRTSTSPSYKLSNLKEVRFREGHPPSVSLDKGVLELKLDPSRGLWGGRPSSKRIEQVLRKALK
jgi:hypothetical protein